MDRVHWRYGCVRARDGMRRFRGATALGVLLLLALTACGGSGAASTRKAQTATAGAANDAATVTAFAKGQAATTPGAQGTARTTGSSAGTPAASAGKGPFFTFATVPAGGTTGR